MSSPIDWLQVFIQDFIWEGSVISKNRRCHTHIIFRDLLTYLLTWMVLCVSSPPQIWHKLHFSNKSRQNSLLAVSVMWISVNVRPNMFAIHYLSQIRHSHWYVYWFIADSCLLYRLNSVVLVYTPLLYSLHVRNCCIKTRGGLGGGYKPAGGLDKSLID